MSSTISCIPHKPRVQAYRVEYLRAITEALDYPWQTEDGREIGKTQAQLIKTLNKPYQFKWWFMTNCCTDSLQMAYSILTKPGDLVLLPAYGWRAIENAPLYMGRRIELIDIDETGNVDLVKLEERIEDKTQESPSAICLVYNFGCSFDPSRILSLCQSKDIKVIEDAAPTFLIDESVDYIPGTGGDITCFSYDFTKNPGTLGSGGAICCNSDHYGTILSHMTKHYQTSNYSGTKSYLDNTSCAVLLKDVELIIRDGLREKRRTIANTLTKELKFERIPGSNITNLKYGIKLDDEVQHFVDYCKSHKILANTTKYIIKSNRLENTKQFQESVVFIPCHAFISDEELERLIATINGY
jgi:dTDP-4-amino-4,6-dideoxygalactose transaminase